MKDSFEEALSELPAECNYDPMNHETIEDLIFIAKHELDMIKERQSGYRDMDGRTRNGIKIRLENFLEKWN